MLHGDDWKQDSNGRQLRKNAIQALNKIGSKLIEIPHTKIFLAVAYENLLKILNCHLQMEII